jgi:hypothetical protein
MIPSFDGVDLTRRFFKTVFPPKAKVRRSSRLGSANDISRLVLDELKLESAKLPHSYQEAACVGDFAYGEQITVLEPTCRAPRPKLTTGMATNLPWSVVQIRPPHQAKPR